MTFPSELKNVDAIPVFKKKEPNNVENCHPVSILPTFLKIYEKYFFNQICIYTSIICSQNGHMDSVKVLAHNTAFL